MIYIWTVVGLIYSLLGLVVLLQLAVWIAHKATLAGMNVALNKATLKSAEHSLAKAAKMN
jgi:hypothetical protein